MPETTTWVIWIDHGYEGEKEIHLEGTRAEAEQKALEHAQDPYVMRTDVYEYPGQ